MEADVTDSRLNEALRQFARTRFEAVKDARRNDGY